MSKRKRRRSREEPELRVVAVRVNLTPEENQRRIARIARWLLYVCGDLLDRPQVRNPLDEDPIDALDLPLGVKPRPRRRP